MATGGKTARKKISKVKDLLERAEKVGFVPVKSGKGLKTAKCKLVPYHMAIVFRPKKRGPGKWVTRCPYCP